MTGAEWAILSAFVLAGGVVQGSIGFGLNVLVAPVAALIDPDLVPAPLLILGAVHVGTLWWTERRNTQIGRMGWVLLGRFPGTLIGAAVLAWISADSIQVMFGILLLAMIATSMTKRGLPRDRATLTAVGVVSGVTGTTVSVGGPPVALVLVGNPGSLRANLAGVQAISAAMSVGVLAASGQLYGGDVTTAAVLLPALGAGFGLSRWVIKDLDARRTTNAVSAIAGLAAAALLIKGLT